MRLWAGFCVSAQRTQAETRLLSSTHPNQVALLPPATQHTSLYTVEAALKHHSSSADVMPSDGTSAAARTASHHVRWVLLSSTYLTRLQGQRCSSKAVFPPLWGYSITLKNFFQISLKWFTADVPKQFIPSVPICVLSSRNWARECNWIQRAPTLNWNHCVKTCWQCDMGKESYIWEVWMQTTSTPVFFKWQSMLAPVSSSWQFREETLKITTFFSTMWKIKPFYRNFTDCWGQRCWTSSKSSLKKSASTLLGCFVVCEMGGPVSNTWQTVGLFAWKPVCCDNHTCRLLSCILYLEKKFFSHLADTVPTKHSFLGDLMRLRCFRVLNFSGTKTWWPNKSPTGSVHQRGMCTPVS